MVLKLPSPDLVALLPCPLCRVSFAPGCSSADSHLSSADLLNSAVCGQVSPPGGRPNFSEGQPSCTLTRPRRLAALSTLQGELCSSADSHLSSADLLSSAVVWSGQPTGWSVEF